MRNMPGIPISSISGVSNALAQSGPPPPPPVRTAIVSSVASVMEIYAHTGPTLYRTIVLLHLVEVYKSQESVQLLLA